MKKFDKVYNNIILECRENKIISEGFFRKAAGLFKSKSGKNKMVKEAILSWMNANGLTENGSENKFIGTLKNGYTIKFTFRASQWNDPESTKIDYAVYLKDEDGQDIAINRKGTIDYGFSDSDIKKELSGKLKVALTKNEAKTLITSKKAVDKAKNKEAKAEAKAKAEEDKKAAAEKAAEERLARIEANIEKDEKELGE